MPEPARARYEARLERVKDAIGLQVPDRVPVVVAHALFYMTRAAGISNKKAMADHKKRLAVWRDATVKLDLDMAIHPIVLPPSQPFSLLQVEQFRWPGGGLPDDACFQFVEREYLKADEYDAFLANPGDFTVRTLWPRLARALEPLSLLPPLLWFSNSRSLAYMLAPLLGTEPFARLLETAVEVGKASVQFTLELLNHMAELEELGFPMAYASAADAPFDYLADQLRGMKGSLLDLFRRPEKVLAAVDLLARMALENAIFLAATSQNPRVYIPLHRGSAGFMSDEQFARFYWPSLKKLLVALVDAGLTPLAYFEGDYTARLEYLAELPKGKILGHFEKVDRKKAKKTIGDTICFWGNVPAELLITGTADQVKDDVKDLIDTFADNGGLIVDGAKGLPDEAKPENVEAMIETVFRYGAR